VTPECQSGVENIERGLSSGRPRFGTDNKENELFGPTPKLEAPAQTTGSLEIWRDRLKNVAFSNC